MPRRSGRNTVSLLIVLAASIVALLWATHRPVQPDPARLQRQVMRIAGQLRTPGDHNSMTVATSLLPMAATMRYQIQQDILAHKSPQQIRAQLTRQYGARVLAAPAFSGFGLWVWVMPWVALTALLAAGWWYLRRSVRTRLRRVDGSGEDQNCAGAAVENPLTERFGILVCTAIVHASTFYVTVPQLYA